MHPRRVTNLLEFSDDIILNICSKLPAADLLSLTETCERLEKIGLDHSLWKTVDLSTVPLSASQLSRRMLKCVKKNTTLLIIKGYKRTKSSKWRTDVITPNILKTIGKVCPNLAEFTLNEAVVNVRKVKLAHFEELKSIYHLGLVDCEFINLPSPTTEGSYFKNMTTFLPSLQSLEISYSNWITDYDLMILSKLDALKKLVLKCDLRIGFTTSYLAISFRFGFKGLEELDMRGTSLTNMEIQSVSQGGLLKCLKLGPIGQVKRLKNDIDEGFGLVIPDPHRREEPKQQVVVINMSPNGPEWRQASDDDLDNMGLQWLKNRLYHGRNNAEKEDEHFFFGKEGKIVKNDKNETKSSEFGECSTSGESSKRKLGDGDEAPASKRFRGNDDEDSEDECGGPPDDETPILPTQESCIPDDMLSDLMVHGLRFHGKKLERLELVGCAISNSGLEELIKLLPKLNYLDVSNSHVTPEGVQQAQVLSPNCSIILNSPVTENR